MMVLSPAKLAAWIAAFAVGYYFLRKFMNGPACESNARIDNKVVIVTGANTGIGKVNAEDLVRRGGKVYLACRSPERGQAAADDIKAATGAGDDRVIVMKLDLGSLKSVREFVAEFKKREKKLHILINNAGVFGLPQSKTEDGFESTFGINHLGHFLLTNLLLEEIKAAAPSRIVTVSSLVHDRWCKGIDFDDIMQEKNYNIWSAYGQSKLANVLFSSELARRLQGTGVTTYSLHPGSISTEIFRNLPVYNWSVTRYMMTAFLTPFNKDLWHGAQTQICCAVDEKLAQETGKYYSDCAKKKPSTAAMDTKTAQRLWELSEKLVHRCIGPSRRGFSRVFWGPSEMDGI